MEKINQFFKIKERKTNLRTEIIAGITTFMTMAYILVVQPALIVGNAGTITDVNGVVISKEAIMVTCALVSAVITMFMAVYANLPFALATGMGSNALFGGMLIAGEISFGGIMSMTLISGLIFLILTIFGIRDLIVKTIPKNIKVAIGVAIGFYIAYLGFKNSGIGTFANGISAGDFTQPSVYLAVFGLILIAVLNAKKVTGAILIGIVVVTLLGIPFGVTTLPDTIFKVPDFKGLGNVMFQFDWKSVLTFSAVPLIFTAFCGDFFSTLGTILGVGAKAGMLDKDGNFPDIQKPFLVDAIGTCVGACTGNTVITTYVESSAGVEAGGRTGFSSIVTAVLFLIMIFLSPLVLIIPNAATGPALIFVGFLMIQGVTNIDFSDFTEAFGPFVMIMFTIFIGSIAGGISAGIIAHVLIKVLTGRFKDLHPFLYILCVPLILYFIF
ncbi:NCS2 family permease [Cuneatibacter caecimuris]|uniref:AGZA family xanthine/uracil permease-like MFS transporter n=1 Tax=Cuneatibacter caecimuris TaxID=1796618 RepID=A0A4Q7NY22_9FIRM|nr:NCS2 family permease [Cuneatibacter caecimuris]RZS92154.1 AGZA family xanthine/uracil permease-like MFS transporter [Cuneatibacter caecimuris]